MALLEAMLDPFAPTHEEPLTSGQFDLSRELEELRNGPQYRTTGHAARTLIKRGDLRVVLVALRQDAAMGEHSTTQAVSVQPVVGRISVKLPERSTNLTVGELLVIESGATHDVTALVDTGFLLSIPWMEQHPSSREDRPHN